jgi:hypothetical protein
MGSAGMTWMVEKFDFGYWIVKSGHLEANASPNRSRPFMPFRPGLGSLEPVGQLG